MPWNLSKLAHPSPRRRQGPRWSDSLRTFDQPRKAKHPRCVLFGDLFVESIETSGLVLAGGNLVAINKPTRFSLNPYADQLLAHHRKLLRQVSNIERLVEVYMPRT